MAKVTHTKRKPVEEKPEANSLEKEIEEIIDREKTKRRIVSKLFNEPNLKNNKSDF